ncbi:MAG: WD repeat-containing protein [Amphiamblys sp. WSBS2006]|nr:MAG: WD repeat-containing protein [Amphiamblys sp. WSBS2006]
MSLETIFFAKGASYAAAASSHQGDETKIAIGSFTEHPAPNSVSIITAGPGSRKVSTFSTAYSPTKLLWSPEVHCTEMLAVSSNKISLWGEKQGAGFVQLGSLLPKPIGENTGTLIHSFDWDPARTNSIIGAAGDCRCIVWDISYKAETANIKAHYAAVYDVSYSADPNIFCTASEDTSLRIFDLRNYETSLLHYEDQDGNPLAKVKCNKKNKNYIAHLALGTSTATITDIRMPMAPVLSLEMETTTSDIAWSPAAENLLAVSDKSQTKIWDLSREMPTRAHDSLYVYEHKMSRQNEQIQTLGWAAKHPDHILVGTNRRVQLFQI